MYVFVCYYPEHNGSALMEKNTAGGYKCASISVTPNETATFPQNMSNFDPTCLLFGISEYLVFLYFLAGSIGLDPWTELNIWT